ncbi:MAG: endonuclease/exonuclease/phosphatase family metal-dependent hydrolase [Flavobacteriales bacterium]|jgi:endonuclease/exonuclease/phosphatase family metal-dependent hydrolase
MKQVCIILLQFHSCLTLSAQNVGDLSFGSENTLEVMTWNLEHFPKNGQTTVDYVVEVIEALDIDIIAIQEAEDTNYLNQMVDRLGIYESYFESTYFAGLAYLYKPDVVQIDSMYEIYTTQPYWSTYPRSPMVMEMTFQHERFIIINNHFKCCGNGILDTNNTSDEETRRYKASNLLKEYIDTYFASDNVIVLGDLNDILTDIPANNVFQMFLNDSSNYLFADFDIALGNNTEWSYPRWPSHLDHILITNELFEELEHDSSMVQTIKVDEYLPQGMAEYDTNISDHRPVAIKLFMDDNSSIIDLSDHNIKFSNYPNPFSVVTNFVFENTNDLTEIAIYQLNGVKIKSLTIKEGQSSIRLNAQDLPNGIYLAKLMSQNKELAFRKLVLMK